MAQVLLKQICSVFRCLKRLQGFQFFQFFRFRGFIEKWCTFTFHAYSHRFYRFLYFFLSKKFQLSTLYCLFYFQWHVTLTTACFHFPILISLAWSVYLLQGSPNLSYFHFYLCFQIIKLLSLSPCVDKCVYLSTFFHWMCITSLAIL